MKNIELELRGEVPADKVKPLLAKLKRRAGLVSKTKRLSVMFFTKIKNREVDIRIRITNGKAEIVVKKGSYHAHNREEFSHSIKPNQFTSLVRIVSHIVSDDTALDIKVGERETLNFNCGSGIVASLVKAGPLAYLEVEKMSTRKSEKENRKRLRALLDELDIAEITSRKAFLDLCRRLSKAVDWQFNQTTKDYKKLERLLKKHT